MPSSPVRVPAGTGPAGRVYLLEPGYYAVHGRSPAAPARGAVLLLKGGEVVVFRGTPAAAGEGDDVAGGAEVGPVYAAPGGPLAVPTGLLFVRFAERISAAGRHADFERAGCEVVQIPGYAPHAAWVRARTGGIAASIQKLAEVKAIPGVESVEPQMLMESVRR